MVVTIFTHKWEQGFNGADGVAIFTHFNGDRGLIGCYYFYTHDIIVL